MSEREKYEAGKEARRGVLHHAGYEEASVDHMEALLRYMMGAGAGGSEGAGPTRRPHTDEEIRARAIDRVLDMGGEVSAVIVAAGSVWLRGHVGLRSEVAQLEHHLLEIPGVSRVDLRLGYDVDDVVGASPAGGR